MNSLVLLTFIILVHSAKLNLTDVLNIRDPLPPVGSYQNGQYSLKRYNDFVPFESIYQCLNVMIGANDEWLSYVYGQILQAVNESSYLQDTTEGLTEDEVVALFYYTTNAYVAINAQLRSGQAGIYNCYLEYLFSAFGKLKLDDSVTVLYSGMSNNGARLNHIIDSSNTLIIKVDDSLISNSLTSSTLELGVALGFAYNPNDIANPGVVITVKNPKSPVPIDFLSMYSNEAELLFPTQANFKVLSVYDVFCGTDEDGSLTTCTTQNDAAYTVKFIFVEVEETAKKPYFESVAGKDPNITLVDCSEDGGVITCPHPGRCFNDAGVQVRCPECSLTLGTCARTNFHGCYDKDDNEIENCVVKVEVEVIKEVVKDAAARLTSIVMTRFAAFMLIPLLLLLSL